MKRIALFAALVAFAVAVNAQNLNVQSAQQDLRKGYLNKAKGYIDKACEHEDTKTEARTWYYAALIYSQIGDAATNPHSPHKKYKDLDPDWCQKAYNAALRCKELDKTNDYANELPGIFRYLGNDYYSRSVNVYNTGDYAGALKLSEEAIKIFNNSGDADFANESYYIAGLSCQALHDTNGVKKYFGPLVRKKKIKEDFANKMQSVYRTMFYIYRGANDTVNVMKIANNYTQALPNDPNSALLLADAYIWTGNPAKGIELADRAAAETKGTPSYPIILCAAAGVHEQAQDFAGAEARYKESVELEPNQINANYGMGIMLYNRGVDKIKAIDNLDLNDDSYDTKASVLTDEYKALFRQAIPYFNAAINFIDSMDEEHQAQNRSSLYNCLRAISTCYVQLEMYDEAKPIQARIDKLVN